MRILPKHGLTRVPRALESVAAAISQGCCQLKSQRWRQNIFLDFVTGAVPFVGNQLLEALLGVFDSVLAIDEVFDELAQKTS